ncbi:hypothetical protein J3459_014102 [Metarhizium acridum]|nr:hypothetical protein J3459_014102 [Metarhizium acridum]
MERPYLLRHTRSFRNLTARVAGQGAFYRTGTNAPAVSVLGVDGVATDVSYSSQKVVENKPAGEEDPVMEETGALAESAFVQEAVVVEQTVLGEETLVAEER